MIISPLIYGNSYQLQMYYQFLIDIVYDKKYVLLEQTLKYCSSCVILHFSLLNAFLLLPKVGKRFYNTTIQALSRWFGMGNKSFDSDATGFHLTNGQLYLKNINNSRKSDTHLNTSDGHLSIEIGDIENVAKVDQNASKELLNDIICDNIVLKNKLDKVVAETSSLRQSLEKIGNRVKEINDVCDI